ncbi:BRX domain-containing protein, partial [Haematococcus lacustris]
MAELDGLGQFRPVLVQEGASIMGTMLQKYGRHGNPKYHYFRVAADDNELQWDSKNGRTRRVALSAMTRFQRGQDTDVFRRYPQPTKAFLSFSIIYLDA